MDSLSLFLERFAVHASVFYAGRICGNHPFPADEQCAHLHVIEQGPVDLIDEHELRRIDEPMLLYLPRPRQHRIVSNCELGARVVCAKVGFAGGNQNPISDSVPDLVAVSLERIAGAQALLGLIEQEGSSQLPGSQASVDRLCELLVIRLLRYCLAEGLTTGGTLSGLSDPWLAVALSAIHRSPERNWTLAEMAAEAGLSRARFAARFRLVTGRTPAEYLASWRLMVAQKLLRSGKPLKQVSLESGYGSSTAFARAFSRQVGMPPGIWLKQLRREDCAQRNMEEVSRWEVSLQAASALRPPASARS